mmetsp:Transcript_8776/g.25247  ORF Transcript_8776/g.25247 Transcript_8776/m.25247 type:complete len:508 (-) Transcript_8776:1019-2542(-)
MLSCEANEYPGMMEDVTMLLCLAAFFIQRRLPKCLLLLLAAKSFVRSVVRSVVAISILSLREVIVDVGVVLASLEVFTLDQGLNALLDNARVGVEEGELRQHFRQQLLMLQRFSGLHDAHDGCLDGDGSVLLHLLGVDGRVKGRHRDADLAHVAREFGIGLELVGRVDLVAGWRLGKDLVLSARQGMHQRLQDGLVQVELLRQFGEGPGDAVVHGAQRYGLQRRDLHVVRLLPERASHAGVTLREDPFQLSLLVLLVVPLLEDLQAVGHVVRQRHLRTLVGGPESRGEDLHGEVELRVHLLPALLEFRTLFASHSEIGQHTLHLGRELRSALQLELGDHRLFGVVAGGSLAQKALGQLVAVDFSEHVLVGQVGKELDDLLQGILHLALAELFASALEDAIAERGHELGVGVLSDVLVDDLDEGILQGALEQGMAGEVISHDAQVLFVQLDQGLHELWIVVLVLFAAVQTGLAAVDDVSTHRGDEALEDVGHRIQPILQPREEAEHAL